MNCTSSRSPPFEQAEDLNRFKICPICATLFVALNEQSQACSPRCSNTLRQRRFWAAARQKRKDAVLAREYREHHMRDRVQRRKAQLRALLRPIRGASESAGLGNGGDLSATSTTDRA
jgi:hypothetical protein